MKEYSDKISLVKNSRGISCLDTSIGCSSGLSKNERGCYGDCYAAKSAKIYGYDFSKTVLRQFKSEKHKRDIISQINKINLDFVRIGASGDPSENWEHTLSILKVISKSNKQIVIITKHWTNLTYSQLEVIGKMNVVFNTSISALDEMNLLNNSLDQYNRIKKYCKSLLRIVSCDFNLNNETGHKLHKIQVELFKNEGVIDTIFRPNKNNPLVLSGVVNVKYGNFLGNKTLLSKYNPKTYSGKCSTCLEMCGVKIPVSHQYKSTIIHQGTLF